MRPVLRFAIIMSALGVASCGSDDEGNNGGDTSTSTDTSSTSTSTDTSSTSTDASSTSTDATTTDADAETAIAPSCDETGECTWCTFPTAPASTDDCYCRICADTLTTKDTCDANAAAWESHCAGDKWQDTANCPVPRCVAKPPLACLEGTCRDGCSQTDCPSLDCPLEEQVTDSGACCPRCDGPTACEQGGDCGLCAYDRPVTKPDECYCVLCPVPVETAACATYTAQYQEHCDPWPKEEICPVPSCLISNALVCDHGECEADPDACFFPDQCTLCAGNIATHAGECRCPGCPTQHSQAFCDAAALSRTTVCDGFDFDACPLVPCAEPEPATCTGAGVCGPADR
ncbi:MAG: hypothetical protein IT385_12250 [Deltaproteobacteria bacterium]|nr:hypothetical protein [Deltaproteobacteria bacterium]